MQDIYKIGLFGLTTLKQLNIPVIFNANVADFALSFGEHFNRAS